jgi:hypothetical protein
MASGTPLPKPTGIGYHGFTQEQLPARGDYEELDWPLNCRSSVFDDLDWSLLCKFFCLTNYLQAASVQKTTSSGTLIRILENSSMALPIFISRDEECLDCGLVARAASYQQRNA